MRTAAPADEADPARQASVTGTPAPGPAAMHAERGQRLAELILAESRQAGQGRGSRLPTERKLAEDLGVTRSSVRHALAVLEAQGRISREVGRGTFLRDLEPPAMPLVVAWATAADLEEMDRCLAGGDQAASYEEFESWDLALHRCIMAASHSPLLAALYQAIEAARHGQVWGDLKRRSASPEHREQYQGDHRAIVAALRARDSAQAVDAMRLHLARVSGHLNATDPASGVTW